MNRVVNQEESNSMLPQHGNDQNNANNNHRRHSYDYTDRQHHHEQHPTALEDGLLPFLYDATTASRRSSFVSIPSVASMGAASDGAYHSVDSDSENARPPPNTLVENNHVQNDDDDSNDDNERRNLLSGGLVDEVIYRRRRRHTLCYRFVHIIDIFLSIVLFSPLVSIFWYCTWSFLDDYFLKDNDKLSNIITWLAGLVILLPSYVFQKDLQTVYVALGAWGRVGTCGRVLMRVLYIYLVSLAVILEWRGVWNLFDLFFFNDWQTQISLALIALTFFCLTKTTRTLVATPFFLYMDDYHHFFTTEHKHQSDEFGYLDFSLDFLLTEIIECIALVAAWRGAENSFDAVVYPDNIVLKLVTSFVSSHSIYLFVALIQHFVFRQFSKSTLIARLIAEDFMYIVMFLSSVFSWKFYWDLMSLVVLSRIDGFYVFLGGHFLVFFVALALKVSAILVGPGTSFLDGEILDSDDSYFQVNYLTTLYTHRLERIAERRRDPTITQPNIN